VLADTADVPVALEALGVAGIAAGGLFGSLYNLEKQKADKLQQEVQVLQQQAAAAAQQLQALQQQCDAEAKVNAHLHVCNVALDARCHATSRTQSSSSAVAHAAPPGRTHARPCCIMHTAAVMCQQ
jgi:uncharacterized protein HemX